ncbi:MAG: hypothetical protein H6Q43_1212 [Deltaproteobacteria bacterium]|nr:hypothetical protein [Deltaproteobacteria bacterium]
MKYKDGVLMTLTVTKWGGAKKLEAQDLGLKADEVPEFMRLGKKLLIPKEEREAFVQTENNARNALERASFPFPVGGARFVPNKVLMKILQELEAYKRVYMDLAASFRDRYHLIREDMLAKYPEHRDKLEPFYPPVQLLGKRFSFEWVVFVIEDASYQAKNGEDVAAAYEKFKASLETQFDKFLSDVVIDLRFQVQETCLKIAERVKAGEIINAHSIGAVHRMIDKFKTLNFIGDQTIESKLEELRGQLNGGRSAEDFKDETARQALREAAEAVARQAAEIGDISKITGEYKRRIQL